MFWIYILKCSDDSYYIGHTDNLENRIAQHHSKFFPTCYTATRLPVQLVFSQEFSTRIEALESERKIKGWTRRKKEAFMRGDWKALSEFSKRPSRRASRSSGQTEKCATELSKRPSRRASRSSGRTEKCALAQGFE